MRIAALALTALLCVHAQDKQVQTLVTGNTAFAVNVYKQLKADGNVFYSPYSISAALAMTYAGARGQTATQMAAALGFDDQTHEAFAKLAKELADPKVELRIANALWGQKGYPFEKDFFELTKKYYGASLTEMDFVNAFEAARKEINAWVEKQTNDKIKELLKEGMLDERTRLVLTNAIYFKADWADPFDTHATADDDFILPDGKTVKVPMMRQTHQFSYAEDKNFAAIELPYEGGNTAILILLPKAKDGIKDLEKSLSPELLAKIALESKRVDLTLPRFKIESAFVVNEALQALGIKDAFTKAADFSGIEATKMLYVSKVVHKAFVNVTEAGTEAAAATGVVMGAKGVEPKRPVVFRADHPFVFVIRDRRTGTILFMGRVADPRG